MTCDWQATAETIIAVQRPDGAIPWDHRGELDPWNHIEAAMGLDAAGRHNAAARAYHWLANTQNPDGSWYAQYRDARPTDLATDSSHNAYIAVGVLHHHLSTQDTQFLATLWPTVDRAIAHTLTRQQSTGEFAWRSGSPSDPTLLAGNSSIHHALRCAVAIATHTGANRPQWNSAMTRLRHTIAAAPHRFTPKPHAMDWYYPILAGVHDRLAHDWHRFVAPGHGVRCVHHEPWVTAAETAELTLTLATHGDTHRATELAATLTRFRHDDGSYWTGYNYATNTIWPEERATWTAGAVLLANAALAGHNATCATFRPANSGQVLTSRVDPNTKEGGHRTAR